MNDENSQQFSIQEEFGAAGSARSCQALRPGLKVLVVPVGPARLEVLAVHCRPAGLVGHQSWCRRRPSFPFCPGGLVVLVVPAVRLGR